MKVFLAVTSPFLLNSFLLYWMAFYVEICGIVESLNGFFGCFFCWGNSPQITQKNGLPQENFVFLRQPLFFDFCKRTVVWRVTRTGLIVSKSWLMLQTKFARLMAVGLTWISMLCQIVATSLIQWRYEYFNLNLLGLPYVVFHLIASICPLYFEFRKSTTALQAFFNRSFEKGICIRIFLCDKSWQIEYI